MASRHKANSEMVALERVIFFGDTDPYLLKLRRKKLNNEAATLTDRFVLSLIAFSVDSQKYLQDIFNTEFEKMVWSFIRQSLQCLK